MPILKKDGANSIKMGRQIKRSVALSEIDELPRFPSSLQRCPERARARSNPDVFIAGWLRDLLGYMVPSILSAGNNTRRKNVNRDAYKVERSNWLGELLVERINRRRQSRRKEKMSFLSCDNGHGFVCHPKINVTMTEERRGPSDCGSPWKLGG